MGSENGPTAFTVTFRNHPKSLDHDAKAILDIFVENFFIFVTVTWTWYHTSDERTLLSLRYPCGKIAFAVALVERTDNIKILIQFIFALLWVFVFTLFLHCLWFRLVCCCHISWYYWILSGGLDRSDNDVIRFYALFGLCGLLWWTFALSAACLKPNILYNIIG